MRDELVLYSLRASLTAYEYPLCSICYERACLWFRNNFRIMCNQYKSSILLEITWFLHYIRSFSPFIIGYRNIIVLYQTDSRSSFPAFPIATNVNGKIIRRLNPESSDRKARFLNSLECKYIYIYIWLGHEPVQAKCEYSFELCIIVSIILNVFLGLQTGKLSFISFPFN